jgi:hypothetical protein
MRRITDGLKLFWWPFPNCWQFFPWYYDVCHFLDILERLPSKWPQLASIIILKSDVVSLAIMGSRLSCTYPRRKNVILAVQCCIISRLKSCQWRTLARWSNSRLFEKVATLLLHHSRNALKLLLRVWLCIHYWFLGVPISEKNFNAPWSMLSQELCLLLSVYCVVRSESNVLETLSKLPRL